MQITDMLAQSGGLAAVARQLGIAQDQAERGADALLPALLGGMRKQADASPVGLGGLLGQLGGGGLLDQILGRQDADPQPGNDVLGEIFGSRDVSRTVAQDAATRTGLDPALLKKMLPLLAMLVTGWLSRQGAAAPAGAAAQPADAGLGGLLGGLLGAGRAQAGAGGGLGGLGALFDANGDGNALDDILRMAQGRR
ncbi:MAG: hypothetical protein JWP65_2872 [Ramlibacter sp.]|jgi:hypothetical protein|uniref:DUF937 domain-containing protein n=1 Tax=Ramlibacter sp. TaxID=1917967 RepID=UPI0026144998|nr:DUF937 domain-containing protein [Ramlibacter sp.]MDB5752451.1 hypothetical protein [Ramlibacter sp.]